MVLLEGHLKVRLQDTHNEPAGVSRRLKRLGAQVEAVARPYSFSCRIHLVSPEKGLTGVLLVESDKPITCVSATPEEVELVRADLERHRAARLLLGREARH